MLLLVAVCAGAAEKRVPVNGTLLNNGTSVVNGTSGGNATDVQILPGGNLRVRFTRSWYQEGEPPEVRVFGFPGNRLDWATIVPYGSPDEEYREVAYARGKPDPVLRFKPLPPGRYELRIFFDEPGLEDKVLFRYPLWVGAADGRNKPPEFQRVVTGRNVYEPNQTIEVRYENMPGDAKDWMTIVPADAARDKYGETMYTEGRNHGNFTFAGFPVGNYEVRVYYDWPLGGYRVQARSSFRVRPAGWDVGRYTRAPIQSSGNASRAKGNMTDDEEGNLTAEDGAEGNTTLPDEELEEEFRETEPPM